MFHHIFSNLPRHIALKFDENQPRDEDGKFTKSKMFRGAGEGSSTTGKITWVTPDKDTAKGYADKRVNGKVQELEVTLGNVFDAGHDARKVTPSKFAVEVLTKAKAAKLVDDKTALQLRADFLKDMDKTEVEIHSLWADDDGKKKVAALLSGAGFDTLQLSEGDKPTYGLIKKTAPMFELTSFAQVFKDNPYRTADGKYTSKEKAAYQVISLEYALKDIAAHVKSQMESTNLPLAEMLKTEDGKKLVKAGAIAYYKHAKHSELSGDTPETLANFVSGSLQFQDNHVPAVQEALKKSLASKKAWDIIGKDNAIKGLDKDILPLLDADTTKMSEKDKAKHFLKIDAKYQHYKKNYMAVGGDGAEFDAIHEKKLEQKLNGTYEAGQGTSTKPFADKPATPVKVKTQAEADDELVTMLAAPVKPKMKGPSESDLEGFGLKNPNDYADTASYEKDKAKATVQWNAMFPNGNPPASAPTQVVKPSKIPPASEADLAKHGLYDWDLYADDAAYQKAKAAATAGYEESYLKNQQAPVVKKNPLMPDMLLKQYGLKPLSEYGTADDYLKAKQEASDAFHAGAAKANEGANKVAQMMGVESATDVVKLAQAATNVPKQEAWKEIEGDEFSNVVNATKLAKQFAKANLNGVDADSDTFKEMNGSWEKAKEYLKSKNIDPGVMYVKQKKLAKAEIEEEELTQAKAALAASLAEPAAPVAPKYKPATSNVDAKEQNKALGVHYYTTVLEKGKESDEAKAAYAEWQKTKDYLKGDSSYNSSTSSTEQKNAATKAFNAKKNAVQAAAAAELQKKVDAENAFKAKKQKVLDSYSSAAYAEAMGVGDDQSVDAIQKLKLFSQKTAEALGVSPAEIKALGDAAQAKAVANKKAAAAIKEFTKNAGKTIGDLDKKDFKAADEVGAEFSAHQKKELAKLTSKEKTALQQYTGSDYTNQNKTTVGTIAGGASNNAVETGKAMSKMTLGVDLKLRRNMPQRWFWESFGIKDFANLTQEQADAVVGKLYTEKAYSSTSKNTDFTGVFSTEAGKTGVLRMNIRAHKDIQGLDVQSISKHSSEQEVILNKGITYVVRKITKKGDAFSHAFEIDVDAIGHMN